MPSQLLLSGKICEEFTTYNLLGTELDFALGDLKKAVAKILKMEPMLKEARARLAKGGPPLPPKPS